MTSDNHPPLFWLGTNRGYSNPNGTRDRLYYGKVFRVSRKLDTKRDEEAYRAQNERDLNEVQANFISNSVVEGGRYAEGECVERFDFIEPDTNDMIVAYRVPYKAKGDTLTWPAREAPLQKAAASVMGNRHERRCRQKQQGRPFPMRIPDSGMIDVPKMASSLIARLERTWPKTDTKTTEAKAIALFSACAAYLAHLPNDSHRQTILRESGTLLTNSTLANEDNLREVQSMEEVGGTFTREFLESAGALTIKDDDDDKPH